MCFSKPKAPPTPAAPAEQKPLEIPKKEIIDPSKAQDNKRNGRQALRIDKTVSTGGSGSSGLTIPR